MALQATFRYKAEVTDCAARRREGMQAKAEFPAKVPVLAACVYVQAPIVSRLWCALPFFAQLAVGRVQSSQLPELTNYKILFPSSVSGTLWPFTVV